VDQRALPFLMFQGQAEEAMRFYVSLFQGGSIRDVIRFGPAGPGAEGTIQRATFSIAGQTLMCTDSAVKHGFGFTPAFSLFLTCDSSEEISRLAASLSEGGAVLMPLGDYGFSPLFAWVTDRFGVSWQLNLSEPGPAADG
jgi:predicted 3-demethylubiquinone-9 3-methyltransferase (glyoxalase superfamily)